jgi:riboflavin synthase alpha subunit
VEVKGNNHKVVAIQETIDKTSLAEWKVGREINLELDHIDGKRSNHKLENLRLLCPNCHSQTDTYRAKNIKKKI